MFHTRKLPAPDIANLMLPYLPASELGSFALVSWQWNTLFGANSLAILDWKRLIERDFGLSLPLQNQLFSEFESENVSAQQVRLFYIMLYQLKKNPSLHASTRRYYQRVENLRLLVACCVLPVEDVVQELPPSEYSLWFEIALRAGQEKLALKLWWRLGRGYVVEVLNMALASRHVAFCRRLFESLDMHFTSLKETTEGGFQELGFDMLDWATQAGCVDLMKEIEKLFPEIPYDDQRLRFAASSGSRSAVEWVLDKVKDEDYDVDNFMKAAAGVGDLKMMKYFVEELEWEPNLLVFIEAMESGNEALIDYLLPLVSFGMLRVEDKQNLSNLAYAAHYSGFLKLKRYPMVVDHKTIEAAAKMGNLPLFIELKESGILVTQEAASHAIKHGHLPMVQYMFDSRHDCRVTVTAKLIEKAVAYDQFDILEHLLNCGASMDELHVLEEELHIDDIIHLAIRHLLQCEMVVRTVLEFIAAMTEETGDASSRLLAGFGRAIQCSPKQFFRTTLRCLIEPEAYDLDATAVSRILRTLDALGIKQYIPTEKRAIISDFDRAIHRLGADQSNLVARLEEMKAKISKDPQSAALERVLTW